MTGLDAAETVVCLLLLLAFFEIAMAGVVVPVLILLVLLLAVLLDLPVAVTGISTTGLRMLFGGDTGSLSGKGVGIGPASGWLLELLLVRRVLGGIYVPRVELRVQRQSSRSKAEQDHADGR